MLDPSVALAKPHLEHELNHKAMRNLDDLFGLMEDNGNFRLTTRAVRFILESDLDEVSLLLMRLQYMPDLLTALYEGIVDDGYDQMAAYAATVQLVFKARKRLS